MCVHCQLDRNHIQFNRYVRDKIEIKFNFLKGELTENCLPTHRDVTEPICNETFS